ncbi:hypothetical protein BGY98DRAFT_307116 [Russula aff. rugulosa BPL654]|nr:hypothetical protein BGY98DRAFT_307116 [Russula aff. rugulosa BPL654]
METLSTQSFKFDCDALYIETHSLHQEGKYQWALIYIDAQGAVTRLPTPTPKPPSRPTSRHSSSTQRESHATAVPAQSNAISNPRGGSQLLGYCKIGGYAGGLNKSELEQVGNAALGGKKDGVRPHGYCRCSRRCKSGIGFCGMGRRGDRGKGAGDQPGGGHSMASSISTQHALQGLRDHDLTTGETVSLCK